MPIERDINGVFSFYLIKADQFRYNADAAALAQAAANKTVQDKQGVAAIASGHAI